VEQLTPSGRGPGDLDQSVQGPEGDLSPESALNEIFDVNPRLFGSGLNRLIHDPKSGRAFAPGMFTRISDFICEEIS
jgi:hypothetical protein